MSLLLYHAGLGDDPAGPCCGARPFLEQWAKDTGFDLQIVRWDEPRNGPLYQALLDRIRFGEALRVGGHSHGAWRARQELVGGALLIPSLTFFIDVCPWGNPFEELAAEAFPANALRGYACWQSHVRPFMPNGVKFLPRDGITLDDCTSWVAPQVGHIAWHCPFTPDLASIAGDARVWTRIRSAA